MDLSRVIRVVIRQDPQEWGRHWNGGDYGYKEIYSRALPGEDFEVRYATTALDFDYCNIYGVFQPCENCREYGEDGCTSEREKCSELELKEIIQSIHENEYVDEIEEFTLVEQ